MKQQIMSAQMLDPRREGDAEEVGGTGAEHQGFLPQGPADQARIRQAHTDALSKVRPFRDEVRYPVRQAHLDLHLRPFLEKPFHHRQHKSAPEGVRRADVELAARIAAVARELGADRIECAAKIAPLGIEPPVFFGQAQGARGPVQQPRPAMRLEPRQGLAGGGSRQAHAPAA
nr:hypothetical protein [Pseudoroseicyclus aestuarii]